MPQEFAAQQLRGQWRLAYTSGDTEDADVTNLARAGGGGYFPLNAVQSFDPPTEEGADGRNQGLAWLSRGDLDCAPMQLYYYILYNYTPYNYIFSIMHIRAHHPESMYVYACVWFRSFFCALQDQIRYLEVDTSWIWRGI